VPERLQQSVRGNLQPHRALARLLRPPGEQRRLGDQDARKRRVGLGPQRAEAREGVLDELRRLLRAAGVTSV
jgi:hypothetical protein